MPTLPEIANGIPRNAANVRGGAQPTGQAEDHISHLASPPSTGNSVEDWLRYLAGQRAVLDKAMRDVQAAIDALEQTAPRAATHDWRGILNTHPGWGGLGFAWSGSPWTTVDASTENFITAVYEHPNAGEPTLYILLQLPRTLDISRYRLLHNTTAFPTHQSTSWEAYTGTVQNATGTDNYYVLTSGGAQHGIGMAQADTITLQEDHGTPASVWIPNNSITPAMLDADDATKMAAMRTRIGAASTSDSFSLTNNSVEPAHLNSNSAQQQLAFRQRIGLVTTQGHTITDDSILPAWLQADSAEQKTAFRTRIGARAAPATIELIHGWSGDAAATDRDEEITSTVPLGELFRLRMSRTERSHYRYLQMPTNNHVLLSAIGESGETVEDWAQGTSNNLAVLGPVSNNGRDPETFNFIIEANA